MLCRFSYFNQEPRLVQLATTIKPQELEPLRLAYEEAKKEFDALLESYPEYITLDSYIKELSPQSKRKTVKLLWMVSTSVYTRKIKLTAPYLKKDAKPSKNITLPALTIY